MYKSSSSVLVLNRTSLSLLHTFVAYTTQLSIAPEHSGNSLLHQHIPRKRLRASSCSVSFLLLLCRKDAVMIPVALFKICGKAHV